MLSPLAQPETFTQNVSALISISAASVALWSLVVNRSKLRVDRDMAVVKWAQEAVVPLAQAWSASDQADHVEMDDALRQRLRVIACELSYQADRGRPLLPNIHQRTVKFHVKPPSRRGYRHAALDELIDAYETVVLLIGEGASVERTKQLFENRRWFSEAVIRETSRTLHSVFFTGVTPRQQTAEASAVTQKFRVMAP